MKNIFTVMRFEYKGYVSAKSFRIVTIVFVAAILILTCLPQLIGVLQTAGVGAGQNKEKDKAAIILSGEALTNDTYQKAFAPETLAENTGVGWVDLSANAPDDAALSVAIKDGEYLFALRYSGGVTCEIFAAGNRMSSYAQAAMATTYITEVEKRAELASLPAETQALVERISALTVEPTIIDIGGNAQNNFWIGYALIMFLFYVIMGYTQYISSSIITEKTSKAMELLVTAVRPIHLMVGKVLGVGFASLTQVGAMVGAAAIGIALNIPYWKATNNELFDLLEGGNIDASIIGILLGFFLLGFFLYAFLAAAFASMVTKPEEAATVTILPITLMLAALGVGFLTLSGVLNKTLVSALSYVPFFTPTGMIARYTVGDAGGAQLALGAGVLVAAVVIVAIFAAKVFRMGVMLYGVKATPKQIWKALRSA